MIEVLQTDEFKTWLRRLWDDNAVARIIALGGWSREISETPRASAWA